MENDLKSLKDLDMMLESKEEELICSRKSSKEIYFGRRRYSLN